MPPTWKGVRKPAWTASQQRNLRIQTTEELCQCGCKAAGEEISNAMNHARGGDVANRTLIAALLVFGLTSCSRRHGEKDSIALPNAKLLGCTSNCTQLWQDGLTGPNLRRPSKLSIDFNSRSPSGIIAVYDKSVSVDDLRKAINARYGKWASPSNGSSPVLLWRVEPDRYAIQVAANEDGTAQVIYMAIR